MAEEETKEAKEPGTKELYRALVAPMAVALVAANRTALKEIARLAKENKVGSSSYGIIDTIDVYNVLTATIEWWATQEESK